MKNNIKTIRELKGLTQEKLADAVGTKINYLSLLENYKREPSLDLLKKIAIKLGVPVSILVLEITNKPKDPLDELTYELFKIATNPSNKHK